jgi:phage terminase large subunit-like protein
MANDANQQTLTRASIARWVKDPVACISEIFIDPESGAPYVLYAEQRKFLALALKLTSKGKLPFSEMLFSAPKKSGKTALAAMCAIYVAGFIGGRYAEIFCLANDHEQSTGRVFEQARRIIEASPLLRQSVKVTGTRIEFTSTGSFIQACANDYSGFAGANPALTIFDELWAFSSERGTRLFDEAVPVPTRPVSGRLTVTYAGFEGGESKLLENLCNRGIVGKAIGRDLYRENGMLTYWTHECRAPWQTSEWKSQMRQQLRPNAYLRLIENRWVSTESTFVEMAWYDACVDEGLSPELADARLSVWVGVDASVKRDSTAIVAVTYDRELKKVRLVWHRIFQPSPQDPLDFESTVEAELLALRRRFNVREVKYDPYQLVAVAQRLTASGLPMQEFSQTIPNLTEASTNLYQLIKGKNLIVYTDADIRLAVSRCVALEVQRGFKIAKEKANHRIDVVVAAAMAALGAVEQSAIGDGAINPGEMMLAPSSRWSARWNGSQAVRTHQQQLDREDGIGLRVTTGSRFGRSKRGVW